MKCLNEVFRWACEEGWRDGGRERGRERERESGGEREGEVYTTTIFANIIYTCTHSLTCIISTHLFLESDYVIKVGVVYVSIDPEQPLEDGLSNGDEIPRK